MKNFTGIGYGSDSEDDDDRGDRRADDDDFSSDSSDDFDLRMRRKKDTFNQAQKYRLDEMDREEAEQIRRKKRTLLLINRVMLYIGVR